MQQGLCTLTGPCNKGVCMAGAAARCYATRIQGAPSNSSASWAPRLMAKIGMCGMTQDL